MKTSKKALASIDDTEKAYQDDTKTMICKHVKSLRDKYGLTQDAMASVIHVNKFTVSRWERGEQDMSVSDLRKICDKMNVSPSWMIGWEPRTGSTESIFSALSEMDQYEIDALAAYLTVLHHGKKNKASDH